MQLFLSSAGLFGFEVYFKFIIWIFFFRSGLVYKSYDFEWWWLALFLIYFPRPLTLRWYWLLLLNPETFTWGPPYSEPLVERLRYGLILCLLSVYSVCVRNSIGESIELSSFRWEILIYWCGGKCFPSIPFMLYSMLFDGVAFLV
jgi:hypothetical protein